MVKASKVPESEMTLGEAAVALSVSYFRAHSLMLLGELEGVRRGHRWHVTCASVERVRKSRQVLA